MGELVSRAGIEEVIQGLIVMAFIFGPVIKKVLESAASKKAERLQAPQSKRPAPAPDEPFESGPAADVSWEDLLAGRVPARHAPEPEPEPEPIASELVALAQATEQQIAPAPLSSDFPTFAGGLPTLESGLDEVLTEDQLESAGVTLEPTIGPGSSLLGGLGGDADEGRLGVREQRRLRERQRAYGRETRGAIGLTKSWKRAVVMAEVLGAPHALRADSDPRRPYPAH